MAEATRTEDVTPFDISKLLALLEHPEVKERLFALMDEWIAQVSMDHGEELED